MKNVPLQDKCQPALQLEWSAKHPDLPSVSAELTHPLCVLGKIQIAFQIQSLCYQFFTRAWFGFFTVIISQ